MMGRLLHAGATAVAALWLAGSAAAEEFNVSIWFPDAHPLTKYGYLEWAEALETASNGDLEPVVFTGTALLPPNAHLSGLRDGIAQMTYHAGTYTPAELPEDNVLSILSLSMTDYFVTAFAVTDFYMNDAEMQAMYAKNDIVYAGGYATPPYLLMCTSKIETLADMKGKKIRMPGAVHSDWAKSVGAVPVAVPSSEMFTGLEKGQLDCAANAANDMKSRSLWDVAKHTTLVDLGRYWAGWEYAFNKDFWQGLTPEQRRLLLDSFAVALVKTGQGYLGASEEALAEAADHGVTVYEPSADLAGSLTDYGSGVARDSAIQQGKEKFGLADPEGLIGRFEATLDKWEKLLEGVDRSDAEALSAVLKSELYDKIDVETYGMN